MSQVIITVIEATTTATSCHAATLPRCHGECEFPQRGVQQIERAERERSHQCPSETGDQPPRTIIPDHSHEQPQTPAVREDTDVDPVLVWGRPLEDAAQSRDP